MLDVEQCGRSLLEYAIEKYKKHKGEREDEWRMLSIEDLVGVISAKTDKMEHQVENNEIATPHMFDEDLIDLLAWTIFTYTKSCEISYIKGEVKDD